MPKVVSTERGSAASTPAVLAAGLSSHSATGCRRRSAHRRRCRPRARRWAGSRPRPGRGRCPSRRALLELDVDVVVQVLAGAQRCSRPRSRRRRSRACRRPGAGAPCPAAGPPPPRSRLTASASCAACAGVIWLVSRWNSRRARISSCGSGGSLSRVSVGSSAAPLEPHHDRSSRRPWSWPRSGSSDRAASRRRS